MSLSLLWLSQGCVDSAYDKDIDMNVQLAGNGLSVPIGETSKFTLNDLIGEDDNLKIDGENAYYISETSNSTAEFPTLESFNIDNGLNPDIYPTPLTIPEDLQQAVASGWPYDGYIEDVKVEDAVVIDPKDIEIPEEVMYIDTAYFENVRRATLTFTVNLFETKGGGDSFDLLLSNLHGELPKMLILSTGSKKGDAILWTGDNKKVVVTDHQFSVEGVTEAKGGVFTLEIPIYGIYGREYFHIEDGILNIIDNGFIFEGDARVHVVLESGTAKLLDGQEPDQRPHISTDFKIQDLNIFHVFGVVDASAEENFDIEIGSMPDFLNDDSVALDLYPYIKLHATNPMGVPVNASLSIVPKSENGVSSDAIAAEINMQPATYNAGTQLMDRNLCYFYLSDSVLTPESRYFNVADEQFRWNRKDTDFYVNDTLYTWIKTPLSSLLDNGVPESIDVAIKAQSDMTKEHEIVLANTPNNVDVDCDMTVPMEFGKDLLINYSEVEGGLDDIFQDFSLEEATINIGYTTTLPLSLEVSLQGLQEVTKDEYVKNKDNSEVEYLEDEDENDEGIEEVHYYKVLKDIRVEILKEDGTEGGIIEGTKDSAPKQGKVIARLAETVPGALKQLMAVRYTLSGKPANTNSANGTPIVGTLRSTQYVQLKLSASIKNIEVDIDSL